MKNLTWQNPEQLFVAQELINKVKSKCCGIKDEKIKEDGKVAIYLATDSEEVKREMKERYGDRIFCSGKKADRGSLEGIREGITDMYTLARTQKIYGSFQSSFSDMAAQIGGVPLEILKL